MNDNECTDTEIQLLIVRYLDGGASDEEILVLQDWLSRSEQHRAEFNQLQQDWLGTGYVQRYATDKAWQKVERRLLRRLTGKRQQFWKWAVGYAAAIVILFLVGYYSVEYYRQNGRSIEMTENIEPGSNRAILILGSNEEVVLNNEVDETLLGETLVVKKEGNTLIYDKSGEVQKQVEYNRLITPRGGEYSVVLSDGTKVWLNAESELKYPVHFVGTERKVYLKGEAYFSVTKQNDRPFVVYSDVTRITVLGTEFNVRNYQDQQLSATLVKGSVMVSHKNGQQCKLVPGQQAIIEEQGIEVKEVETMYHTAWKDGYFIYDERNLDEILKELSRWYDFTYFYQNKGLENETLTAKLRKFDRVEKIFEILSETGHFDFVAKGKTVTVVAK